MKKEKTEKTFLCQEGSEQFTITAIDLQDARDQAAMWNAVVIKQLRPKVKMKKS